MPQGVSIMGLWAKRSGTDSCGQRGVFAVLPLLRTPYRLLLCTWWRACTRATVCGRARTSRCLGVPLT